MNFRTACVFALCFVIPTLAAGQAPPTETVAPNIPGVVAGGTRVQLIAQNLRGTEGPIAGPDGNLLFTEQQANVITKVDANNNRTMFLENTNGANGLTFDPKGRLIGTQPDKAVIAVLSPSYSVLASSVGGKPFLRPNDVVADKKGGVYFTDPGAQPAPGQTLPGKPSVYYIAPSGTVMLISDEVARPNGIILSPDERVLYVADTVGEFVVAFDVQPDGSVRNRRDFARLQGPKTEAGVRGGADGLAVDSAGRLYVATTMGVQVFSAQGMALGTIPIGVANGPQNLAFAGPGKKTLYVVGRGAAWKISMLSQGPQNRAK
jgi:gluconolactonase